MITGYIYKTTNLENNKVYIGQHKGRFNKNYLGSGTALKNSIKKYGREKFIVEMIFYVYSQEELDLFEKHLIDKYRQILGEDNLYNISEGGGVQPLSPSSIRKISNTLKGRYAGDKNPYYGKKHSPEILKKISEKVKGRFGEKSPSWKGGIAARKHKCMDCDKQIWKISLRCKSCTGKIRNKDFSEMSKKRMNPWNKGLKKYDHPSMMRIANSKLGKPSHNKGKVGLYKASDSTKEKMKLAKRLFKEKHGYINSTQARRKMLGNKNACKLKGQSKNGIQSTSNA